jgi:peptidoglycan/LPS O-acetylase OafA/YrhL
LLFRNDINGLRAIAVIAVLLFHFNSSWLSGGFAGVDVFFVISGYLMTGIIFKGLMHQDFSLSKFYLSRANRILPALAALCVAVLLFSYLFVHVIDQLSIHKHTQGSIFFYSNFIYMKESGYFDVGAHFKWLLHTWSLSVEWQFYIIYPLVLLFFKRFTSIDNLKLLILIATIIGFIGSALMTLKWPSNAYYMLPSRAWEMLIGGVAFLYPFNLTDRVKKICELVGICLIIYSYFFISGDIQWPGIHALLPVFGTYLIIVANRQSSFIASNKLFKSVGQWSYSIYLWHWPLVVIGVYFSIDNWWVIGIPLSFLFGFLSFKYIENCPTKKITKLSLSSLWKARPAISVYSVLLVSAILSSINGFNKLPEDLKLTEQEFRNKFEGHANMRTKNQRPLYINSSDNDFEYIIIGDSFARHYNHLFKESGLKVVSLAVDGCYSTQKFYSKNEKVCIDRYKYQLDFIAKHRNKKIIVSRAWNVKHEATIFQRDGGQKVVFEISDRVNELNALVKDIQNMTSSIYVIAGNQGSKVIPFKYMANEILQGNDVVNFLQEKNIKPIVQHLSENKKNKYTFIDVSEFLCENSNCYVIKDGKPLYTDHGHFSKFGTEFISKDIVNFLREVKL